MTSQQTELRIFQNATGRQRLQTRTVTSLIGDPGPRTYNSKWVDVPVVYQGREENPYESK